VELNNYRFVAGNMALIVSATIVSFYIINLIFGFGCLIYETVLGRTFLSEIVDNFIKASVFYFYLFIFGFYTCAFNFDIFCWYGFKFFFPEFCELSLILDDFTSWIAFTYFSWIIFCNLLPD